MEKPRVFYLTTSLNMGGTEQFLATLVEHLGERCDITVGFLKEKGFWGETLERKGVPVSRITGFRQLVAFMEEHRFHLLHTFLYRANILGRIAGKQAHVPVIVSTQQAIDDWKRFYHVWLDRWTAAWCDAIVANAQTTKHLLESREGIPPGKIRVVYNGLDHAGFVPRRNRAEVRRELDIPEHVQVVICVLRLHREKGADYLPEISARVPEAVFLVVGDGPERERIEQEAGERGLGKRFRMTGWRRDIPDLLKASDIFLLPSREESLPQSVLEAMAAGLPVVAADVGGVRELVEDRRTGFLVERGNVEGFGMALHFLAQNTGEAGRMGTEGHRKSTSFTETAMIERIEALYQELLRGKACI